MTAMARSETANVALAIKQPRFLNPKEDQGFDSSFEFSLDLMQQSEVGSSCMSLIVEVGNPWSRSPKIADVFAAYLSLIRHQKGLHRGGLISHEDAKNWRRGVSLMSQYITSSPGHEMGSALGRTAVPICREADWLTMYKRAEFTKIEVLPQYKQLNDETAVFIEQQDLKNSIAWLQSVASVVFGGADFEIDLLPAEDGEDNMLALRVYGSLPVSEFRELRHQICEAMLKDGHKKLYNIISIFQRRTSINGRQDLSWYSPPSAE